MTIRNLDQVFRPQSIAVLGASEREGSIGAAVWRNLTSGGFAGALYALNPKYTRLQSHLCYANVSDLPLTPDLAILCTPASSVPGLIESLADRGCRAAIVVSAGLSARATGVQLTYQQLALQAARPRLLRVLGSNCLGVQVPAIGLNASFAHLMAGPGSLAFVSQSGALVTTMLDWAASRGIGFSHVVSLGDMIDVDFGDMLDYLALDPQTKAILLYAESITHTRKFMSAARCASRVKPVVIIKAGRSEAGAKAVTSHTGALAGADAVCDAAFRRAGMLRVSDMEELFTAAETLEFIPALRGERLGIVTNGGGLGVLAADALTALGGTAAVLSAATLKKLDEMMPTTWSHGNPVDIIGDAPPQRYRAALHVLSHAAEVDAVLVLNCPTAVASGIAAAQSVVDSVDELRVPLLTCWAGEQTAARARELFVRRHIATYATPEAAVRGFMHRVQYQRAQQLLLQAPAAGHEDFIVDRMAARAVIEHAINNNRSWLSSMDVQAILTSYQIPVVQTAFAQSADGAGIAADQLPAPYALKIESADVIHKSDAGGVQLGLASPAEVQSATAGMEMKLRRLLPQAKLDGFIVQPMMSRSHAHELIVGLHVDAQFGPVVMFGHGGVDVEALRDSSVGLPPLNRVLAQDMIEHTRVSALLKAHRDKPAANMDAIADILLKVSQLAIDLPEITELDINPLLADESGVIALDARIRVSATAPKGLTIRPYPRELETSVVLADGQRILFRPVMPEDTNAFMHLLHELSPEDVHMRFFQSLAAIPASLCARLTQIDYDREMAFVARAPGDSTALLGIVHLMCDPDGERAEFAIIVDPHTRQHGLGLQLMKRMIEYAKSIGVREVWSDVLPQNVVMLDLCRSLGFEAKFVNEMGWQTRVSIQLSPNQENDQRVRDAVVAASPG